MKFATTIIASFFLFSFSIQSKTYATEAISDSIRFILEREEGFSPIVYHFSHPQDDKNYPILILCQGSSSKGNLESILSLREYLSKRIESLHVGKAYQAGAPITYLRIDGMDHDIKSRPEVIDQSFEWLKEQLTKTQKTL